MKRFLVFLLLCSILLPCFGCAGTPAQAEIVATTLPVYEFTSRLCRDTGLSVTRLVTESVSCLHDYSLSVRQVKAIEGAQVIVLSGGGLEDFMTDALSGCERVINSSHGISLNDHHEHAHGEDPHIWLSPENAKAMATNICRSLTEIYPQHNALFTENLNSLIAELDALESYGEQQLSDLSCRQLITFHDGFHYLAETFELEILKAVEEESGSEASAMELKELTYLIRENDLPAIFTERSGSVSAAGILSAETGVQVYSLDMAMAGSSYFEAMYHNIDTLKEALG